MAYNITNQIVYRFNPMLLPRDFPPCGCHRLRLSPPARRICCASYSCYLLLRSRLVASLYRATFAILELGSRDGCRYKSTYSAAVNPLRSASFSQTQGTKCDPGARHAMVPDIAVLAVVLGVPRVLQRLRASRELERRRRQDGRPLRLEPERERLLFLSLLLLFVFVSFCFDWWGFPRVS